MTLIYKYDDSRKTGGFNLNYKSQALKFITNNQRLFIEYVYIINICYHMKASQ
jgi:hypothetical protein